MKTRKLKAFTLLEMMGALVIFAAGTGVVVATSQAHLRSSVTAKIKMTEHANALVQKTNTLRGLNPEELSMMGAASREMYQQNQRKYKTGSADESRMEYSDRVITGKTTITTAERSILSENTNPVGFMIFPGGSGASGGLALIPPTINYGGMIDPSWFPIGDFLSLPSANPSGTIYLYTTDGSEPTSTSSMWTGETVVAGTSGGLSIPQTFKVVADHPDPSYTRSATATAIFSPPSFAVSFSRSDGGNSRDVDYFEIENGTNQLVLSSPFHGESGSDFGFIRYTVNEPGEPEAGDESNLTFHLPHSEFSSSGATIRAKLIIRNPNFSNSSFQTFNLNVAAIDLPAPDIIHDSPHLLDDNILITNSDSTYDSVATRYHEFGDSTLPDPTDASASSDSFKFPSNYLD